MKSFSLQISRDEGLLKSSAEETGSAFGSLNFDNFEDTWQHCADWLRRNALGNPGQIDTAFSTLIERAQAEEIAPGAFTFSMLHELQESGSFQDIPRELACALFGHQRWDFIPADYRLALPQEENEEIINLLQYLGVAVISFSKRVITLAHSDPWIAHLASRRLSTLQTEKAASRAVGVINLPTDIHRSIFEQQLGVESTVIGE
ncbi:MAG: hypothetical protein PW734_01210 [Verrucomicrobium sp.]|nr:hypothetical protein [Verrucomicrobium sp.]